MTGKLHNTDVESILVKLPNWMGDILFSYDLLFSLSQRFQRIALLTSTQHQDLFQLFPIPNAEVIAYLPENWPFLDRETILKIEQFQPDSGLLLPNSFGAALALRLAGVSKLTGFNREHRRFLLKNWMSPPSYRLHQREYYLRLLQLFDLPPVCYPLADSVKKDPMVTIHPGASKMERAWHLNRYLRTAETLKNHGLRVVFVSAETIDVKPFEAVKNQSLKEFAQLLRSSKIFIGNDSGPLHLAQQCGTPVVGVYGPGNPMTSGPRPLTPFRVVYHAFPCSPCRQRYFRDCEPSPNHKPYCIESISVDEVVRAALDLLQMS